MDTYIIAFFIFSFLGWIWESVYCTIRERKWANRGFLYGPICPIYGFGALIGFFIYDLIKAGILPNMEWYLIFVLGFFVSMVLEYPTSWALEKIFKARWWDYSHYPLNINGRTSVPTSLCFGVAAILLIKILIPFVDKGVSFLPDVLINILALIIVVVISIDATLTISSLTDFQKYIASIDEEFQNHMTDIVNRVYDNRNSHINKAIQRIVVFKLPGRKNKIAKQLRKKEFVELIKDYYNSDIEKIIDQHGATMEHCENVAWISYLINEKLHLNADEKELIEAAMLHDIYLYEWNEHKPLRKTYKFNEERSAESNSPSFMKEYETIRNYMWPLSITKIPKSKEAMIIYFADKYCTLIEKVRLNKRYR